uniref:G-protein coupled receptors family 1 profile domain-containing protein n=1 Tax=Cyprinus carpio TaxID=7962 RepID=A0A8C1RG87_CYPCA
ATQIGVMSDNTSLSSVSDASLPPLLTDWTAPSFTPAAQARVTATMVLFLFAAVSNLALLISVSRGRRLASHLRPLIISLASADLMMTFIVMPLDMVWNVTVQKQTHFYHVFRGKILYKSLFIFRTVKAESVDFTQCVTHGSFRERWHETAYNMFHFVTLYVIPLLVMSGCYTCILIEINRQLHKSNAGESLRRSGTDMIPKARMKTLKMTIIIVLSFVVCWTPYYLLGIWYWFQPEMLKVTPEYIHHLLFVFGNLNTCCDPVIYGLYTPSFRADLARCCRCRTPADSPRSLDRLSARHENTSLTRPAATALKPHLKTQVSSSPRV